MKVFIKKLIIFFIIPAVVSITACDLGGGSSEGPGIDVTGTYNVTVTENGKSSETDVWILKQTGNDVAVLWGEAGPMTVSGSNLIIAWPWDEGMAEGILAISGDTIEGTIKWIVDNVIITTTDITMIRTSTSAVIPEFNIPEASIAVDGVFDDWDSVATYVDDADDDATEGTGTDIQCVTIARDGSNVYLLIETDELLSTDYSYDLEFHDALDQDSGSIGFWYNSSWQVYGTSSGIINVSDGYIELSFPYDGLFTPGQKYIVKQKIGRDDGDDFYLVDEADFIGYTILPK